MFRLLTAKPRAGATHSIDRVKPSADPLSFVEVAPGISILMQAYPHTGLSPPMRVHGQAGGSSFACATVSIAATANTETVNTDARTVKVWGLVFEGWTGHFRFAGEGAEDANIWFVATAVAMACRGVAATDPPRAEERRGAPSSRKDGGWAG